jgi:hypothetical protein
MDAGEDVIEVDAAPATKGGRAPGPRRAKGAAAVRSVVVRCTKASAPDACPAPCRAGVEWAFDRVVPAGICLEVAGQLLTAVVTARGTGRRESIVCPRGDCGAEFNICPAGSP